MVPFGQQPGGPGGMNVGGPGTINGGMNMGPSVMGMGPGSMGGAPGGINPNGMPGGMNVGPGMNPAGMNVNPPGMGNMPPNAMNMPPGVSMGPNPQRQGGMPMRKGPGHVPMPTGGMRLGMQHRAMNMQNGMSPGLPGQGAINTMPTLTSGLPNMPGGQGAMGNMGPGAGGPGGPAGAGGMGGLMQPMGGVGGAMSVGAQQGGIGGPNMGPGPGPGMGPSSGMGGMPIGLGMAGSGPGMGVNGMRANTMVGGPWQDRQFGADGMVKRTNTGQLDDFANIPGPQSLNQLGPQPQHPHGVGGPHGGHGQHGVGGPNPMAPHPMAPQMGQQAPSSQPTASSPVGNLPAHPPQMGSGTPAPGGPMGPGAPMGQPGGTPRLATPGHTGGQLLSNPPAPSPHRIVGSPAHHQGHPHQPHIAGSPAHQMSSPQQVISSSPAPGQGPHPSRSNAPTPVPPRGPSADPMNMRPDNLGPEMRLPPESTMIGGIGSVMRGPDGSLRPANELMNVRDGRLLRDIHPPMEAMNRAPSADGIGRPGMGIPPNGPMRPGGEIGRLGPDGTMVRPGPYNNPPPYATQGNFGQPYGIHPTPAQQHQNMQIQQRGMGGAPTGPGSGPGNPAGGVPRSASVDDMSGLGLPDDLTDVIGGMSGPGRPPGRGSLPPQMPVMGVRGPAPNMTQRRPTLVQMMPGMPGRPLPLGMGVVRMLEMSQELGNMNNKMLSDWERFREEYFTRSAKITMTIFYGVEGRKYLVAPELIPRFFLAFFESGVNKMSLGLNGAMETTHDCQNENLESRISTLNAVWRYELDNGWIVEHNGPVKIHLVAEQVQAQGEQPFYKLKIEDMTCNAPTTSYYFRADRIEGNLIQGPSRDVGPMTPRISPGLAARQTGEPVGDPNHGLPDEHGTGMEHEERLVYDKASLPPKPFQTYGLPAAVWRLLAMSACVHELVPVMEIDHSFQMGPLAAFDQYAEMDQHARQEAGLDSMPEGMGGHSFSHFNPAFPNPHMPDHSPALAHAQMGMNGPPQGAILTTGRPTPTPPPTRPGGGLVGGHGGPMRGPLAGSGELPPLPGLGVAMPAGMPQGMIISQSPLLAHHGPPGPPPNGQIGVKRKQQPEQGPDPSGASGSQPLRGNVAHNNRANKSSPVLTRKKAKTNLG
ncbi:Formin-like protein 5 [Rhizoctonia solani]|uniref:Formin-like protein 5 n=1 Tax=Rhizoctonia solani TaxID=456999 RepID=A0A0K6FVP7_9AGAM|nr:Formin-like protein 5 [Rhizoctonia solani]